MQMDNKDTGLFMLVKIADGHMLKVKVRDFYMVYTLAETFFKNMSYSLVFDRPVDMSFVNGTWRKVAQNEKR